MKHFEYGDREISEIEIFYLVSSFMIAIGALSLPRQLAEATNFFDGWISLTIAGIISISFTGVTAKLTARFPKQTFLTYAASICSKPVAMVFTVWSLIHFIIITAVETRFIAIVANQYLFDRTPTEIIALLFLLVVVYAVSGSRVGVIRLNMLFLPIILVITLLLLVMDTPYFDAKNLSPIFTTSWKGYWEGVKGSFFSLSGYTILFFYMAFVNRPKKAPKYAMLGVCVPLGLYILLYMMAIGVFSAETTATIVFPTVELGKVAELPGGFLGRLEVLFFTIWIMAIFNTASLAFDVALMAVESLFKRVKKMTFIFIVTPFIYLIAMFPQDLPEASFLIRCVDYSSLVLGILLPSVLLLLAKVRGIKGHG